MPNFNNDRLRLWIYLSLFFISGFCGLIYESIWTHYLKLFLGHASYAQVLVLIIYMGGMAVGAFLVGKYTAGIKNLLLWYAIIEVCLGLAGFLFHDIFSLTTQVVFFTIIPELHSGILIFIVKWGLTILLILPQTVLLGSTFPLIAGGIIRRYPQTQGRTLSVLYFLNSLGASIGMLVSGFFLISRYGLPGTIITASIGNIFIAVVFLLLLSVQNKWGEAPKINTLPLNERSAPHKIPPLFLICAVFTGTAAFLYEIGWIRMLNIVLGNTSHAFELMVSAFILGLALGGLWIKNRIDSLKNPERTLGIIQILMGICALSTIFTYDKTFYLMLQIVKALSRTDQGYVLFSLFSHGICMLIMLPAAICSGMILPLVTYILLARGYGEGTIGKIYSANTLGSILGVIIGIQFLMTLFGLKSLIIAGAGINCMLGILFLRQLNKKSALTFWVFRVSPAVLVFIASAFLLKIDLRNMVSSVYLGAQIVDKNILFHRDGRTATVDFARFGTGALTLAINGRVEGFMLPDGPSVADAHNILLAALPLSLNNGIKTAAIIGMGSGMTPHVLLGDPEVKAVDLIEIEPAVVDAAKSFGRKVSRTFNDPRCHIFIDDAKSFFANKNKKYDLIISFPSQPWVSGVSGLFSKEFYSQTNRYMSTEGLFVQWITLLDMNVSLVVSVAKALSANFNDYCIYYTDNHNIMLIASQKKIGLNPDGRIFSIPELKFHLETIGIFTQQDLKLRRLGCKKTLDPFLNTFKTAANSDFYPVLATGAEKAMFLHSTAQGLELFRSVPLPMIEILDEDVPSLESLYSKNPMFFSLSNNARQAVCIFRYFDSLILQKPGSLAGISAENSQVVNKILMVYGDLLSQGDVAVIDWLQTVYRFAELTIPYLSSKEMEIIWDYIAATPALKRLSDPTPRLWINLYKAVSSRNFTDMCYYAELLMPFGTIEDTPLNNYLLSVSMAAHIVLKRKNEVIPIWQRYQWKNQPSYPMVLLASHILDFK